MGDAPSANGALELLRRMPGLRSVLEQLPLARHFLQQHARTLGRPGLTFSAAQEQLLLLQEWTGNVRELSNVIQRAVILSTGTTLRLDLACSMEARSPERALPDAREHPAERRILTVEELAERERANLVAALESARWRISGRDGAAELLGWRPRRCAIA